MIQMLSLATFAGLLLGLVDEITLSFLLKRMSIDDLSQLIKPFNNQLWLIIHESSFLSELSTRNLSHYYEKMIKTTYVQNVWKSKHELRHGIRLDVEPTLVHFLFQWYDHKISISVHLYLCKHVKIKA